MSLARVFMSLYVPPSFRSLNRVPYSTLNRLENCLNKELKLEKRTIEDIPTVRGFELSYSGSKAILSRSHQNENIKVEIDANHAIEVTPDDGDGEDLEPFFVPAFTVTISKPSGSSLQLELSFDGDGSYSEQGNEWDNLQIDSACILPPKFDEYSNLFTADAQFLSEELLEGIKDYIQERGIDEQFASDIVPFYQNFEHHNYVSNFLNSFCAYLKN